MRDELARVLAVLHSAVPGLAAPGGGGAASGGMGSAGGLDGTALAEALWLAARMAQDRHGTHDGHPRPVDGPGSGADGSAPAAGSPAQETERAAGAAGAAGAAAGRDTGAHRPAGRGVEGTAAEGVEPAEGAHALHERLPGGGARLRGHAVAAPRASGLPRALELTRALRPWKRPWPQGRHTALDIDATVDGYARSGELIPVLGAAPERWFDLVLVVDRSPTMRVWQETLTDFTSVLDRLGAFRTLTVRDLEFDAEDSPLTPGQLRCADGRRLVVVVSDCTAPAWRAPRMWRLLREWAATTPTALLNPLPTKLWRRGGLNLPTVRFTAAAPGAHRSRLPHDPPPLYADVGPEGPEGSPTRGAGSAAAGGDWLPIPVLSLSPHSLGRWSRAVMRSDPEGCTAVLVPPGGRLPGRPRPPAVPLPPATVAKGFLRTGAPRAVRLAVLCSPFDRLSLQLLHVIRRELVPDATTADVAEVVTSGLFPLEQSAAGGPVELVLPTEAAAVLREQLPAHEAWRVHRALDRHVASRGDGRARLLSVVHDEDGARELTAEREAFARASRQTLELLGLSVPSEGTTEVRPPDVRRQAPARTATESGEALPSPDDPPANHLPDDDWAHLLPDPLVGMDTVALAERLARRVIGDTDTRVHYLRSPRISGTGVTTLALHVAQLVRDHFPDGRFFVDLRGGHRHPVPAEAALYRLLTELGAAPAGGPHTAEELAGELRAALHGRRVLLVLNDARDLDHVRHLLPGAPGCAVLVTGRHLWAASDEESWSPTPLDAREARTLLVSLLGTSNSTGTGTGTGTRADKGLLRGLTDGGYWWPLTVRLVAGLVASRWAPPRAELVNLVRETCRLYDESRPLDQVPPIVRLRLDLLPAEPRQALGLLSLAGTGELTLREVSALLGRDDAAAILDVLLTEGLLEYGREGRYRYRFREAVHREVRESAAPSASDQLAATARLLDLYLPRAASLHAARHPRSRLARLAPYALPDQAWRDDEDVWIPNALALIASGGPAATALPRRRSDLLLLLQDLGASTPYWTRYREAGLALLRSVADVDGIAYTRALTGLAHAFHRAGETAEAIATLGRLTRSGHADDDPLTRGHAALLAGRLHHGRDALREAEAELESARAAFLADGDEQGLADADVALAWVLIDSSRPGEAVVRAEEALRQYADDEAATAEPFQQALLCLARALADAGRLDELLVAQNRLRTHLRSRGDRRAEGQVLIRVTQTLLALDRPSDARTAARTAVALLEDAGDEDDRAEARRLLRAAENHLSETPTRTQTPTPTPTPRTPTTWTIIAIETDGGGGPPGTAVERSRILASLLQGIREQSQAIGRRQEFRTYGLGDGCLVLVDRSVPLGPLLTELAERLPESLESVGEPPMVRLAVHTGTVHVQSRDVASQADARLTLTMLRLAHFRQLSDNYPFQPTLCVSPEAFALLGSETEEAPDGLVAGRFVPSRVTTLSGVEVCVVLTPHIDLSAYDAELLTFARVFNDLDPDGHRTAALIRDCVDTVLAPEDTGRFDVRDLDADEQRRIATTLETALDEAFPFTRPFRLKLALGRPDWEFAPADHGAVCLLVRADDPHARWSAGLLRVRPDLPAAAPAGLPVLWLHRGAALPENVVLRLPEPDRAAVLAPASAAARTAELFRRVQRRPVADAALRAVTRRRDSARRVREAAAVLRNEGVLVLGGNRRGRELAVALRLPVPAPDEYVSVRLTRRRPHHTRPSVLAGGVAWVTATADDPAEPLPPDLPTPRRPR
ncbi:NaeI family type II restriction endonuclease [Streptomyces sp. TRM64462]|uniref:NaeI family type II restriction endonuclease n=1 Tax=Streptomyces sp. TRM64462 TaxID=2741726 RepID=UPI001586F457|nr:NaeI family type II restriction endonuclease [Streptomyces sp. TRM64462]